MKAAALPWQPFHQHTINNYCKTRRNRRNRRKRRKPKDFFTSLLLLLLFLVLLFLFFLVRLFFLGRSTGQKSQTHNIPTWSNNTARPAISVPIYSHSLIPVVWLSHANSNNNKKMIIINKKKSNISPIRSDK